MAVPFPMGSVPMAMMYEFLANLQEDEEADQFMENAADDTEEPEEEEESNSQEEMIRHFKKMRAQCVGPGGIFGDPMLAGVLGSGGVCTSLSVDDAKPQSDTRSLVELKPMLAKELVLHTTHRGHFLCGWIAVDDAFFGISSSSLLLEDVTGRLVEIAAYDLVDTHLPPVQRQRVLAREFAKGKPIAVIEPYYKVRMDSTVGIRIDDAQELIPWRDVPTDLNSWKKLGNEYFSELNTQNKGCGVLACYRRALETVQRDAQTIAVLLSNLATCRFKVGDYVTSIQLSGAAVHLNPSYFKAWCRLASALVENEVKLQNEGKVCHPSVVARVVAYARSVLSDLSSQEQQMLENTLPTSDTFTSPDNLSQFHSYAEWCVVMDSLEFVCAEHDSCDAVKGADAWCKEGSSHFARGDLSTAESCYRKGLAASVASCRDISLVLNNIAAVHLSLFREECKLSGSGTSGRHHEKMPGTEAALLNCTVAGILDPLNHKAWARRTRCLKYLGFTDEECTTDLQTIRSSVLSKTLSSTQITAQVQKFKMRMSADIQHGLQQSSGSEPPQQVPVTPTNAHSEHHDVLRPPATTEPDLPEENAASDKEHKDIDEYIARMEDFVNRTRSAYTVAKSQANPRLQQLPREITMFLENPPPPIHTEFSKLRGWPDGIDPMFARKVLYRSYLDASVNPWIPAHNMLTGKFFKGIDFSKKVKRWHGTGALEILRSRRYANYGDIADGREVQSDYVPNYEKRSRANFASNPSRVEIYYLGTTHVAIGLTDFSGLLAATLHDISHNGKPLKFVGFEMSEFAVAKCKVVAHMLASSDIPIWNVMEVWLSSVWSDTTLKIFRKSVNVVLGSLREQPVNAKVMTYLRHWASTAPISASKAHSQFFMSVERCNKSALLSLFSFRRKIDQLDLMQYMLTGEIRASCNVIDLVKKEQVGVENLSTSSVASPSKKKRHKKKKKQHAKRGSATAPTSSLEVGSLTMWSVPDGSPPLEGDIAFTTVEFMKLLEDFEERESKQTNSTANLSVVDLFVIHIMKNLHRLRELMLANKLTIEMNYGVVKAVRGGDPEDQALLKRIASMRPDTMSWSNMLDRFLPEDFHDLARRCSMYGGCAHYGYSTKWPAQVFGASIIDYDPPASKSLADTILYSALGLPDVSITDPMPSLLDSLKVKTRLDKLLFLPFREHPIKSTGYVLAQVFNEEWINHFIDKGKLNIQALHRLGASCTGSNCELQLGSTALAVPNPLFPSSQTLHMSWCYDPGVHFVELDNPLESNAGVPAEVLAWLMHQFGVSD